MKPQQTKRKFYNRWLYKATLFIKSAAKLRTKKFGEIGSSSKNDDVVNLAKLLDKLDSSHYAVRIENTTVDIYTNDQKIFDLICCSFITNLRACYAPAVGTEDQLNSGKIVVANKLPHDKFEFKVFLQPHNLTDLEEKRKFLAWLDSQQEHILISNTVKTWFIQTKWNWDRRYIYVDNEQTLLMLKMKNAKAIGTVYRYVMNDK